MTQRTSPPKQKKRRTSYKEGGDFDPNVTQSEAIRAKLSKNCRCTKNCVKRLREYLLQGERANERFAMFEQCYKKFVCGTREEKYGHIVTHLMSHMKNDNINYIIMNQHLCRRGFEILNCSSNCLTHSIIPRLTNFTKSTQSSSHDFTGEG